MKRRERATRRAPTRPTRSTILVYCGALRTEPAYFDGLKQRIRGAVTVKVRQRGIAPDALVRVADTDEFDIAAAVAQARRHRVHLAVSNPCFELWLLLHHADCRTACAGYADVVAKLKKHLPAYDKARLGFADFADGVGRAVRRGRELDPTGADHRRNPSTGVWRLVETIMEK